MALAALVSCTKSEVLNQESLQEKGITFSAYVGKTTQTKATTIDPTNAAQAGIGILAWRTGGEKASNAILTINSPAFMPNIRLELGAEKTEGEGASVTGTGIYTATYSPTRYWPSTGSLVSFYAYAPYCDNAYTENAKFHPENLTVSTGNGAHKIILNVPKGNADIQVVVDDENNTKNINSGMEYANQTDFMVAKVGNGDVDAEGNPSGKITTTVTVPAPTEQDPNATREETVNEVVGINQNLNKDHEGAVTLQMKHALSKISFEVRAGDYTQTSGADKGQNEAYEDVKVVFDYITINGLFVDGGTYNLFNQQWEAVTGSGTSYSYKNSFKENNTEAADDAFNPIADEVYNHEVPAETTPDNSRNNDGYYKLNKSSHDLMIIPVTSAYVPAVTDGEGEVTTPATESTPATITSITGKYMVQTFETITEKVQDTDENGAPKFDNDGNPVYIQKVGSDGQPMVDEDGKPVYETVEVTTEIENYRDNVYFTTTLPQPLELKAGKHYIFRFDIKLKEITFEVAIDGWDSTDNIYKVEYIPETNN